MATKTYYEPKEEAVPWLVGIDMQKFICGYGANFIGSSYVSCVGIGCQLQWGFANNTGRPYITFPFKFSNVFTAISCICHNGSPSEANTVYNVSISGMNIGASGGGSGKYWCAFGVAQQQWGYYTAAVGAIYTDVTTPVSFSRCFFAASIDILLAASTTWPGTTQTVWNINASTANKLRFIWAKAPIELDGAVWFGIFIQTVGKIYQFW